MSLSVVNVPVALVRFAIATLALIGTHEIWLDGDLDGLVYFTNQAGLMLAVVMIWAGFASLLGRPQPPAWLKGGVTLFLAITGLISYFVLAPEAADAPAVAFGLTSGTIEHEITPVAAFLDFVLLDAHRRLRLRHAAYWLGYLLAYCVFATVRGLVWDLGYPYGFIDLGELGWGGLALNVAIYGVGFYVLGLALVGIDRLLPARALVGRPAPDRPRTPAETDEPAPVEA